MSEAVRNTESARTVIVRLSPETHKALRIRVAEEDTSIQKWVEALIEREQYTTMIECTPKALNNIAQGRGSAPWVGKHHPPSPNPNGVLQMAGRRQGVRNPHIATIVQPCGRAGCGTPLGFEAVGWVDRVP